MNIVKYNQQDFSVSNNICSLALFKLKEGGGDSLGISWGVISLSSPSDMNTYSEFYSFDKAINSCEHFLDQNKH